MNRPEAIHVFCDGASGIYIPQRFANEHVPELWTGIDSEDLDILRAGPEHEFYDDAWSAVLDDATATIDGNTFTLYQDGDLFAVCPDLMSPQEYQEFFGEERQ